MSRYIRRGDILAAIKEAGQPLPFDEIYDSFFFEPDPIDLQCVIDDMIQKGRIEKVGKDGRDCDLYDLCRPGKEHCRENES